ncbi:MAG: AAA family ATPase [Streptosporangiaceae bacterium]
MIPQPPAVSAEALRTLARGNGDTTAAELLVKLRDGGWLDRQTFPPLQYAVPGVVAEGLTLLVAPPKAGKSWLVLGVALAAASGGCALGVIQVDRRPVLYLALEDGDRRMQERCRALLAGDPIPTGLHYLTAVEGGAVQHTIAAWLALHPACAPLVVLDTLGKVMPPALAGESAYQRDYRIGGQLKRLCDEHRGTSLVVVHHDRKASSEDFIDSVSGTHGLAGSADSVLVLARGRGETCGLLKVTGRDIAEAEYAVTLQHAGTWTLDGPTLSAAAARAAAARATAGVGDRSAEIVTFVGEYQDGVRANEVEQKLGRDARRYLARLAESGRLVRLARGLYAIPPSPVPTVPLSQLEG